MSENKNAFYSWIHRWIGPIFQFFFPIKVEGLEHVSGESVILCPNHSSALDPIMMVCALPRNYSLRMMAKKQLMDTPIVGWFLRKLGAFGVDRGNSDIQSLKTAIRSLREGSSLLIFPEGTRVKEGMAPVRAKAGAAMFAFRNQVPLVPVYIPAGRKAFRKNTIVIGEPYLLSFNGKPSHEQYQEMADDLMIRICQLAQKERSV